VTGGGDCNEFENKTRKHSIQRTRQRFLYAYDVVVWGRAVKYVTESTEHMKNVASEIGSTMYVSKPNI